jgi:hypothetical protein
MAGIMPEEESVMGSVLLQYAVAMAQEKATAMFTEIIEAARLVEQKPHDRGWTYNINRRAWVRPRPST